ncbi:MAG TPA: MOSC domain-containing protein [bacterium]|nr:MOSC domain-containing protein [bacterium]
MSTRGIVRQINVSRGGVPKRPVPSAHVGTAGIEGDGHNDPRHGGPDAAVCVYSIEAIQRVAAEGHPIAPGTAGENLTVEGLDWSRATPGARLRCGDVVLEVTRYTTPCRTIRGSFRDGVFDRIHHQHHPGDARVYARVLATGTIAVGETIEWIGGDDA